MKKNDLQKSLKLKSFKKERLKNTLNNFLQIINTTDCKLLTCFKKICMMKVYIRDLKEEKRIGIIIKNIENTITGGELLRIIHFKDFK